MKKKIGRNDVEARASVRTPTYAPGFNPEASDANSTIV